jgi:hypothetical protein
MRYLGAHPDVFVPPRKEVHFFDRHWDRGLGWYEAHFDAASSGQAMGEGTPSYLYDDDAMARVRATLPAARLLVMVREPVDRAYSQYWHARARGWTERSFTDELAADADAGPRARSYIERGRYIRYLRALEPERAAGRLLVVVFEDLRDAPLDTYRAVCGYLELAREPVPAIVGQPLNEFTEFRSLRVRDAARRMPKLLQDAVGRLNVKRRSYPPLDPAVRARLAEQFEADNAALATWLGRDLSVWRQVFGSSA